MKKLLLVFCVLTIIACKEEPKNYVTLSGKIDNPHESKTLRIFKGQNFSKEIILNEDGTFNDTLKVEAGDYSLQHGQEYGSIYLKNNNESSFTTDYEDFDNTLVFTGDDADINNYSIQSYLVSNKHFNDDLFSSGLKDDLSNAMESYKKDFITLKEKYPNVDSLHLARGKKQMEGTLKSVERYFNSKLAMREAFPTGAPSPTFVNYENIKGGTTSLEDLKGKYVYVDVWATWCGPCKREIPSLKEVEKKYHGKDIEFVSISVDNGRGYKAETKEEAAALAKEGWKKMIAEKELSGIQLYADNAWESDFITEYQIRGIPRFILIDPEGNIVSADAPRPSSEKLIELFNSLNI